MVEQSQYEVYLRVSSDPEDDRCLYTVEHWFVEKPDIETVAALFDEAKRDYSLLYPDDPPDDFTVSIRRLKPREVLPPRSAESTV